MHTWNPQLLKSADNIGAKLSFFVLCSIHAICTHGIHSCSNLQTILGLNSFLILYSIYAIYIYRIHSSSNLQTILGFKTFSGVVKDYSLIVPPTSSRDEICAWLSKFQVVPYQMCTKKLMSALSCLLKEKRSIHDQVEKLSTPKLKSCVIDCVFLNTNGKEKECSRL